MGTADRFEPQHPNQNFDHVAGWGFLSHKQMWEWLGMQRTYQRCYQAVCNDVQRPLAITCLHDGQGPGDVSQVGLGSYSGGPLEAPL